MNKTYIANRALQDMVEIYGEFTMDKNTCHELAILANRMVDLDDKCERVIANRGLNHD